jgi:hypothetical protein
MRRGVNRKLQGDTPGGESKGVIRRSELVGIAL